MGRKKYIVDLTDDERTTLDRLVETGKVTARKRTRAGFACRCGWPSRHADCRHAPLWTTHRGAHPRTLC